LFQKSDNVHHNAVSERLSPPPGLEKQRKETMTIRKEELAFNGLEDKENNEILLGKCSTMLLIVVG